MKNIFRFLMAAAIIFGAVSCAKEDISTSLAGGEVEVTFTADLGQLGTRVYGDGKQADYVYLGVYNEGGELLENLTDRVNGEKITNGKATIRVVLLKDKHYKLVFWAQHKGQECYSMDWATRQLTVDYSDALSQEESRDAFFLVDDDFHAGHDETVFTLKRPFAQLRAAISKEDFKFVQDNKVAITNSEVVVEGIANVLDLTSSDAEVSGNKTVTFASAAIPNGDNEKITVNGTEFYQLSMNYLLVNEKTLVDVEYTFTDGQTNYVRPYYAVPVQRNYRTNILGQIISSPIDFTVVIDPIFKEPAEEVDAETQIFDVHNQTEFEDALKKAAGQNHIQHLVINLYSNVILDINAREALAIGNKNTKDITINGSKSRAADDCYTLTFNNLNSDWNNIATNGAKLILNNLNLSNRGKNDGPWNRHDLNFVCDVEMNNVVSDKAIAVAANATLNRVTISDVHPKNSEAYALWIRPNGQTVTLDKCTIVCHSSKTTDRGIKIDNQYLDDAKKVILNVSNTSFTTQKKAAIVVNTPAGAEINLENIDITGVAADSTNAVWVDEKAQAYADLVTVTGGTMIIEGSTMVTSVDELKEALASNVENVVLQAGVEFDLNDKIYYINNKKNISTNDATNKPTLKGKFVANADIVVTNVAFAPNAISTQNLDKGTYGTYVIDTYSAIFTVNRTGATFEGCEFNGGENYVVAINYFQEAANKVMNVNNCAFTQTYIYSKVKCHLSNNTFELNECPYPICVWPCPAGSTNNECTFVNNTVNSNNPSYRPLVMLLTQSTPFANVVFNVQGNSGNYMYAYGWVTKARCATDGSVTFAEGSSKFTINADGTLK